MSLYPSSHNNTPTQQILRPYWRKINVSKNNLKFAKNQLGQMGREGEEGAAIWRVMAFHQLSV